MSRKYLPPYMAPPDWPDDPELTEAQAADLAAEYGLRLIPNDEGPTPARAEPLKTVDAAGIAPTDYHSPWIKSAAGVRPKMVMWVWYPFVPAGVLTVLFGAGGSGKSTVGGHFAAHITRGQALPGDECAPYPEPRRVLWVGFEDDFAAVTCPRLTAMGADMERVDFSVMPDEGSTPLRSATPEMSRVLDSYCEAHEGEVGLVVIDHLSDVTPDGRDINKRGDVVAIYDALRPVARKWDVPIVVIHHSNKGDGAGAAKASGSTAITDLARSAIEVWTEDDAAGRVFARTVKHNLGPARGMEYELHRWDVAGECEANPDKQRGAVSYVECIGETDRRRQKAGQGGGRDDDRLRPVLDMMELEPDRWWTRAQIEDLMGTARGGTANRILRQLAEDPRIRTREVPARGSRGGNPGREYRWSAPKNPRIQESKGPRVGAEVEG